MIQEITIRKISVRHLAIITKCYEGYGSFLAERYGRLKNPSDRMAFSIIQELYYEAEKYFSGKKLDKEEIDPKNNKKITIKAHTAMVLEEALYWYENHKIETYEIPYLENLKYQINNQLT